MALAVFTLKIKLFKERVAAVVCVKFKVPVLVTVPLFVKFP